MAGGGAQANYGLPLAQFFTQAFAAAEGTGAAAILPYKYIPYAYTYDASLYEFGINSDAGTYAVSAMVKHQAERVRPLRLRLGLGSDFLHACMSTQLCKQAPQAEAATAACVCTAAQQDHHQRTLHPWSSASCTLP